MESKKYKSKYNTGDTLADERVIIKIDRLTETNYTFLLYCDVCKTEQLVKRQGGLKRKCTGCAGKIWRHETEDSRIRNKSFTNYRYRAIKRGYEFSLTRTHFLEIISRPCFWCGEVGKVGVDRLDNYLGYSVDNSVASCKRCNYAKNDMSLNEWQDWINRIAKHNQ